MPVKVTLGATLTDAALLPVVFAPDAKRLLFVKNGPKHFTYTLMDRDGKDARDLSMIPTKWHPLLAGCLGANAIAPNAKQIIVFTVVGQLDNPSITNSRFVGGACDANGKYTPVDIEAHLTGAAFAGEQLFYLDSGAGHQLKQWDGKKAVILHRDTEEAAQFLRASPDGGRVAYLAGKQTYRLVVYDLKSKELMTSDSFEPAGSGFGYHTHPCWDAEGKGLFYHRQVGDPDSPSVALMYWNLAKKQCAEVLQDKDLEIAAVLDQAHLAVNRYDGRPSAILRWTDRKWFPLPDGILVLGGRGTTLALRDDGTGLVRIAEVALPK